MYILLNRENVVVDILAEARYIKLQSSNGIVVACGEDEGTGVIGSDCDTHYTLVKWKKSHLMSLLVNLFTIPKMELLQQI